MKIFIKKVIFFTCILFLFFIVNIVANYTIFNNSKVPVKKANIWIVGDSHPQKGFKPTSFLSAENISSPGEPYIITFWKLKYIFKQKHPDTLIIGFAQHNFSSTNDRKFSDKKWEGTMFERTYLIGNYDELKDIEVNKKSYYNMFLLKMCLYPSTKHFEFIGKYVNSKKSKITDSDEAIKRHFFNKDKTSGLSKTSSSYLDSIINLCKIYNVKPILIGIPVTKVYFDKIPNLYKEQYEIEKKKWSNNHVPVVDMTNTFYADKFYLNSDHLNDIGAAFFSNQVREYFATNNNVNK